MSHKKYNVNRWDEGYILFNDLEGLLEFLRDFQNTMFYTEKYVELLVFPQRLLITFLFNRDLKEDWIMFLDLFLKEDLKIKSDSK